jgi:gentisate 1,2-dioxygenase
MMVVMSSFVRFEPAEDVAAEPELEQLYRDFAGAHLVPLWTERADLMPPAPHAHAVPAVWRWASVVPLAGRAGHLVPVGRGGERRALALSNPGLDGQPYATPTLWAAVQYLGPRELAPSHRHSQGAFRFMLQGQGAWTTVNGDAVELGAGDVVLTPAWTWHEHRSLSDEPAIWLDGLDIPLVRQLDAGFFEPGSEVANRFDVTQCSRSELLWGYPGLRPVGAAQEGPDSPLLAYRRIHLDAALSSQIELQGRGAATGLDRGHAAVRLINPATGDDALTTMRLEMHRVVAGMSVSFERRVGSSVWQLFDGVASLSVGDEVQELESGDIFAIPSWSTVRVVAHADTDLFMFNDAPVYEKLALVGRPFAGVHDFMFTEQEK